MGSQGILQSLAFYQCIFLPIDWHMLLEACEAFGAIKGVILLDVWAEVDCFPLAKTGQPSAHSLLKRFLDVQSVLCLDNGPETIGYTWAVLEEAYV